MLYVKKAERYTLTCRNIPAFIDLTRNELEHLYYEMENTSRSMPFSDQLNTICEKAATLLGYQAEKNRNEDIFSVAGRSHDTIGDLLEKLHIFDNVDYVNKVLLVKLKSKKKHEAEKEHELSVGLFAFSIDKNKLYILCKRRNRDELINIDQIISVHESKKSNEYEEKTAHNIFEKAKKNSIARPKKVVISFRRDQKAGNKIKKLEDTGILKRIDYKDDMMTCEFSVNSTRDLAVYLKSCRSCITRVIEPRYFEELLSHPDTYYESPACIRRFESSFDLSSEKEQHVKVAFLNIPLIRRRVKYLANRREQARITVDNKELIYEDTLRGLSDFARYLRQYGSGCHVLEPDSLKDMMLNSAHRTLERYEEY